MIWLDTYLGEVLFSFCLFFFVFSLWLCINCAFLTNGETANALRWTVYTHMNFLQMLIDNIFSFLINCYLMFSSSFILLFFNWLEKTPRILRLWFLNWHIHFKCFLCYLSSIFVIMYTRFTLDFRYFSLLFLSFLTVMEDHSLPNVFLFWSSLHLNHCKRPWCWERPKAKGGRQRMRCLDSITNSMDVNLSKLWKMVKNREACHAAVPEVTKSWTGLSNWRATITWLDGFMAVQRPLCSALFCLDTLNFLMLFLIISPVTMLLPQ